MFPGSGMLPAPHSQRLGLFSLPEKIPGFGSIVSKKSLCLSPGWQLPQAEPCSSSSTADPVLLFREYQCWDMAGTHPCFTSKISCAPVTSKAPWHPGRCCGGSREVAPCFQLLQLVRRSCGMFNPFLLSLFPRSCCCSDGGRVEVALSWGQWCSGSSGPCSHGLGMRGPSAVQPLDLQWERDLILVPLCPVRFPGGDAGVGPAHPRDPFSLPVCPWTWAVSLWPPPEICILSFC